MRIYYEAFGWFPRTQTEFEARNELRAWARSHGPQGFQRRVGTARAQWDQPYTSRDRTISYTTHCVLLPFMEMGTTHRTHGWVLTRHQTGRTPHEQVDVWYIDAIRCLPVTDAEMRIWGTQPQRSRHLHQEWHLVRGYNNQYNLTLRARLMSHHDPGEAHRQAVRDMHRQGVNLVFEFAMELASPANVPTGTLLRTG